MAKSRAKRAHSISVSGDLMVGQIDDGAVTITEILDSMVLTYDLSEILEEFNGKKITITIKEDTSVEPTEVEGEE